MKKPIPEPMHFDGPEYNPDLDQKRLTGQIKGIYDLMKGGRWLTLFEIAAFTGYPEASISAQLRHLRKERFGRHVVRKQRIGDGKRGYYAYQLIPNTLPIQKRLF